MLVMREMMPAVVWIEIQIVVWSVLMICVHWGMARAHVCIARVSSRQGSERW